MSLKEKVMIVNLSITQWSARKFDAKVSKEVENSHNATNAGRFNKLLIADEELKATQKVANSARTYHYFNTLPWSDNGDRILTTANYWEYVKNMGEFKQQFFDAVANFMAKYETLRNEARNRLGTMYNETDYPSYSDVHRKFNISFNFTPVSDGDDLRVSLSQDEVDKIRHDIFAEVNSRIDKSVRDIIFRVKDAVAHAVEKLSDKSAIFRDSLIGNITALVEIMPKLNFNNDPFIDQLAADLRPLCVDPELLRTDPAFREQILNKARAVLKTIN